MKKLVYIIGTAFILTGCTVAKAPTINQPVKPAEMEQQNTNQPEKVESAEKTEQKDTNDHLDQALQDLDTVE